MSNIIGFALAVVLTIAAAALWLKSGVSETVAGARLAPGQTLSTEEITFKAGTLPEQNVDDRSLIFIRE